MSSWIQGVFWTALLHGILVIGAYLIARHGFRQACGMPLILATATVAWAWVNLGMQVLGVVGGLARGPMMAWCLVLTAIGFWLRKRASNSLDEAWALNSKSRKPGWESAIALGLTFWACSIHGFRSLLLPVKVMSDGPIYHLWFAAKWWKEGRLFLVPAPFGESVVTYFPCNGDLWFSWLMINWGGDLLARVGQAPFLVVLALAVYGAARALGAGAPASILSACWLSTSTTLLIFNFEANVDTIFTAGYMLAAYFFLLYAIGDRRGATLWLGALGAGLCWGTKPSGLVFVPPLLAVAAVLVIVSRGPWFRKLTHLGLLALGPLLMTGGWYAANAWRSGNPLYPLQVEAFGRTLLTGWYSRDVMTLSEYYIDRADRRAMADMLLQVFPPRQLPFWLAAVGGLGLIGRHRNASTSGPSSWRPVGFLAFSVICLVNITIYWELIPYRTQQRFLFPALAAASVPLASLLDRARWIQVLALISMGIHVLTPMAWPWGQVGSEIPWDFSPRIPNQLPALVQPIADPALWRRTWTMAFGSRGAGLFDPGLLQLVAPIVLGLLSLLSAATIVSWLRSPSQVRLFRALGAIGLQVGLGLALIFPWGIPASVRFYPVFPDYYRGWLALDLLAGRDGARIAYAGTNLPYFLLGPRLKNEVNYVNIDEHPDWRMHDYHHRATARGEPNWPNPKPGWDREAPDEAAWLENLRAMQIELLVVARHNVQEAWPIERMWAEGNPGLFRPEYGVNEQDPLFRVYRFLSGNPRDRRNR